MSDNQLVIQCPYPDQRGPCEGVLETLEICTLNMSPQSGLAAVMLAHIHAMEHMLTTSVDLELTGRCGFAYKKHPLTKSPSLPLAICQ